MEAEGERVIGGRGWFVIDSKSFKTLVETFKGKISGVVTEKGQRFSMWIRLRERGLSFHLERMEA